MEQNNGKFRLRLNLFDGIILVLAALVGGALLWFGMQSGGTEASPTAKTVVYTVRVSRTDAGVSQQLQPGDPVTDNVENHHLGTVVSVQAQPAQVQVLDQVQRRYVNAALEGYEDLYLTVEASCTQGEDSLLLDGSYEFRVGQTMNLRAPGFIGSGVVVAIEREVEG